MKEKKNVDDLLFGQMVQLKSELSIGTTDLKIVNFQSWLLGMPSFLMITHPPIFPTLGDQVHHAK